MIFHRVSVSLGLGAVDKISAVLPLEIGASVKSKTVVVNTVTQFEFIVLNSVVLK